MAQCYDKRPENERAHIQAIERLTMENQTENKGESQSAGKDTGATMLEYALMALLIMVACVAAVQLLGIQTSASFSGAASGFKNSPINN